MTGPRLRTGGVVDFERELYVVRDGIDAALLATLASGDYAFVYGPTQIGKSSLLYRTRRKLEEGGVTCVYLTLQSLSALGDGGDLGGVLGDLVEDGLQQARLDVDGFAAAAVRSFDDVLSIFSAQAARRGPVALFIDEVNQLLGDNIKQEIREQFFAALRVAHTRRQMREAGWADLVVCFSGFVWLSDFVPRGGASEFNVGQSFELRDFSLEETLAAFTPRLAGLPGSADRWLQAVHAWAGGHPFLTQRLVEILLDAPVPAADVDMAAHVHALVRDHFLTRGVSSARCFAVVDRYLAMRGPVQFRENLQLHLRLHAAWSAGKPGIPTSALAADSIMPLWLGGIARRTFVDGVGLVCVRNRLYAEIFHERVVHTWLTDFQLNFAPQLERWQRSGRKGDVLLQGRLLDEALKIRYQQLTRDETEFIELSRQRRQRRRIAVGVALGGVLVALAFYWYGEYSANKALATRVVGRDVSGGPVALKAAYQEARARWDQSYQTCRNRQARCEYMVPRMFAEMSAFDGAFNGVYDAWADGATKLAESRDEARRCAEQQALDQGARRSCEAQLSSSSGALSTCRAEAKACSDERAATQKKLTNVKALQATCDRTLVECAEALESCGVKASCTLCESNVALLTTKVKRLEGDVKELQAQLAECQKAAGERSDPKQQKQQEQK